jgi:hypothetical protein
MYAGCLAFSPLALAQEALPDRQVITPTRAPGATFNSLNSGLADFPDFTAGQGVTTVVLALEELKVLNPNLAFVGQPAQALRRRGHGQTHPRWPSCGWVRLSQSQVTVTRPPAREAENKCQPAYRR